MARLVRVAEALEERDCDEAVTEKRPQLLARSEAIEDFGGLGVAGFKLAYTLR